LNDFSPDHISAAYVFPLAMPWTILFRSARGATSLIDDINDGTDFNVLFYKLTKNNKKQVNIWHQAKIHLFNVISIK
ncbi:MAG: hypothetical protein E6230_28915, partial [Paenibacillus dendritiformis]|nr:hypothetical protein [Paenibacillus dendritiformis]